MTDILTPTPLGFTSGLLDTLSSTRTQLDVFVSHHKSQLDAIVATGGADRTRMEAAVTSYMERLSSLESEDGAIRKANIAKRQDLERKEAEIAELEARVRTEGGDHIEKLREEEEAARVEAEKATASRMASEASKSTSLELLTKSIVSYREGLSLDFERAAGNRLRLVFTNVNPASPSSAYAFTVNVNDQEEYEVEEVRFGDS